MAKKSEQDNENVERILRMVGEMKKEELAPDDSSESSLDFVVFDGEEPPEKQSLPPKNQGKVAPTAPGKKLGGVPEKTAPKVPEKAAPKPPEKMPFRPPEKIPPKVEEKKSSVIEDEADVVVTESDVLHLPASVLPPGGHQPPPKNIPAPPVPQRPATTPPRPGTTISKPAPLATPRPTESIRGPSPVIARTLEIAAAEREAKSKKESAEKGFLKNLPPLRAVPIGPETGSPTTTSRAETEAFRPPTKKELPPLAAAPAPRRMAPTVSPSAILPVQRRKEIPPPDDEALEKELELDGLPDLGDFPETEHLPPPQHRPPMETEKFPQPRKSQTFKAPPLKPPVAKPAPKPAGYFELRILELHKLADGRHLLAGILEGPPSRIGPSLCELWIDDRKWAMVSITSEEYPDPPLAPGYRALATREAPGLTEEMLPSFHCLLKRV